MGYRGDAILQFDWTVGEIIKALEQTNLLENTMIILTSDNGPVVDDGYADHSQELLGNHKPGGKLRGGKYSSFEAGTRVPFIVHWPIKIKPGISNALFSHIDIFASMEKLIGKNMGANAGIDSREYLATLIGENTKGCEYIIESSTSLSISDGEWKYITPNKGTAYIELTNTETGNSIKEQLYNLRKDIGEKDNVAIQNPEKVTAFKNILKKEMEKGFRENWTN